MSDEGLTVFNGRYELLRRIARGGMADVYLARDASLDRQVAVKVLFPEFANDPSFVERFRREAKAAANLNHPNIVGIYDWGQEQGTYYIVMEYVVGRSMADVMRSTGRLSPDRAAEIAADVAEALSSAHNAGLVHRDIKLGNIIVSDDGQVKVADFGIATALARRTGDNLTHIGSVMGTATYFSPEQAQGKALDGRSDLYSLGVVLYEMIVGKPPFTADTSTAVAVKHVQERPLAPSLLGVSIVESLEAIILKLLAKNPANRYPKAEDLRADLQRYLAGAHSIPTRTGQSPRVATGRSPRVGTAQSPRVGTGQSPRVGTAQSLRVGTGQSPRVGTAQS
ncbi:MAG: protein kinase, partial [Acidimicrobiaceae bacterium]|nr:protein kinase [Acidimicrobiaceae bacterium]